MRERIFFIIASAVFLVVVLVSPETGFKAGNFLIGRSSSDAPGSGQLALENRQLHIQLDRLLGMRSPSASSSAPLISAAVFSRYPFNYKSELTINAGRRENVEKEKAVLAGAAGSASSSNIVESGFLVGSVKSVNDSTAVVETLLDTRWSSSVAVGKNGVDALLSGGLTPTLGFIPKSADVISGDGVYSTDPRFPYGVAIGRVLAVGESEDKAFRQATVELGYDMNALRNVFIVP